MNLPSKELNLLTAQTVKTHMEKWTEYQNVTEDNVRYYYQRYVCHILNSYEMHVSLFVSM